MPIVRSPLRVFWFVVGVLALVLGAAGVVLPLLPTTPFVILAAFAFSRSVPAFAERLQRSRTFGPMIADWRATGAIAPRHKRIAVVMMAGALLIGMFSALPFGAKVAQVVLVAAGAAFVLSRPNPPPPAA